MSCWCSYCRPGLWILVNPCRVYNCANDHHSLLFPSIRAIVNSLNLLPLLPLIAELDCFSWYMNMRPNRMTLWLTCVVHNTVTTQFWKSNVGMTPGASVCTGSWLFSLRSTWLLSRTKRDSSSIIPIQLAFTPTQIQVNWSYPSRKLRQTAFVATYGWRNLQIWLDWGARRFLLTDRLDRLNDLCRWRQSNMTWDFVEGRRWWCQVNTGERLVGKLCV